MTITNDMILKVIKHCSIIHHTHGRLRVRLKPSIIGELKSLNKDENLDMISKFKEALDEIEGINKIKLNKAIASLTIEYDKNIFSKEFWEDALNGRNLDILKEKLNQIMKGVA